jgi:hypothetical protein
MAKRLEEIEAMLPVLVFNGQAFYTTYGVSIDNQKNNY